MAHVHEYPVTVQWSGGREGSGSVTADKSGVANPLGVPAEFQGTGAGTNPEELLASAVAGCYSITFGIIAANQKLPVTNLEVKAVGEVEQSGASFTYKKITIRPRITVAADATDEQIAKIEDMSHKADAYCIITNAVRGKVEIAVEQEIIRS
ncbi:MAG: OsmC family protein [Fimbriimonadaceae bacterium]|nr:OsmC family protein [Fimbriimonadaceae bacterium]